MAVGVLKLRDKFFFSALGEICFALKAMMFSWFCDYLGVIAVVIIVHVQAR